MAILSSATLISSLAIFNLICAYFVLTAPQVVAGHNIVTVLAASVNLPVGAWPPVSDAAGLLAAMLMLLALADLSAVSLREEVAAFYWQSQAPLRLTFFFGLAAYSYSCRPGGMLAGHEQSLRLALSGKGTEGGLGSGVVFTWAFLEMTWWFWVFLTLRDERRERAVVSKQRSD